MGVLNLPNGNAEDMHGTPLSSSSIGSPRGSLMNGSENEVAVNEYHACGVGGASVMMLGRDRLGKREAQLLQQDFCLQGAAP